MYYKTHKQIHIFKKEKKIIWLVLHLLPPLLLEETLF